MKHVAALQEILQKEHAKEVQINLCRSYLNKTSETKQEKYEERLALWLEQPALLKPVEQLEVTAQDFDSKLACLASIIQSPEFSVYYLGRLLACQEEVRTQRIKQDLQPLKNSQPALYDAANSLITLTFQRIVHYPLQLNNLLEHCRELTHLQEVLNQLGQSMRWFITLSKHLPNLLDAKRKSHTAEVYAETLSSQIAILKTFTQQLMEAPLQSLAFFSQTGENCCDAEISLLLDALSQSEKQRLIQAVKDQPLSPRVLTRLASKLRLDAYKGNLKQVAFLLDLGVDITAVSNQTTLSTALHKAIEANQHEVVKLLIERGAEIEAKNGVGRTPLHAAVQMGRDIIVPILLAAGAKVQVSDSDGNTPLHSAVLLGDTPISEKLYQLLLTSGADWNAINTEGQTAADLSQSLIQNKQLEQAYHKIREEQLQTLSAKLDSHQTLTQKQAEEIRLLKQQLETMKSQAHLPKIQPADNVSDTPTITSASFFTHS